MATSLCLKSWEIANIVYGSLLRYPFHLTMLNKQEKVVLENQKIKQLPLYILLVILLVALLLFIHLGIQAFKTLSAKPYSILLDAAFSGMVFLGLVLAAMMFHYDDTFVPFYNVLLKYQKELFRRQTDNGCFPLRVLLNQGIYLKFKLSYFKGSNVLWKIYAFIFRIYCTC